MKLKVFTLLSFISFVSFSQDDRMFSKISNFYSFSESKIENLEVWKTHNDQTYWVNPDFGKLPNDAPCTNCVEVLSKRKEDERFFVDINDRTIFYQQKSLGALHYLENNQWRRINTRIKPNGSGIYTSNQQIDPTYINSNAGFTSIKTPFGSYNFNNWKLYGITEGEKVFLSEANWTNKTVGDDGMIVYDCFPGIDLKLEVFRGRIKSSFVVHHNYYQNYSILYFQDQVTSENGPAPLLQFEDGTTNGRKISEITVKHGLIDALYINQAIVFPEGDEKNHSYVEYDLFENNFGIYIPRSFIQNSLNSGKNFIIDPTVTSTNTLAQASITGSGYNATCFNGFCSYNLTVPTPANATITDVQWSFVYMAYSPCWMQEGANTFFLGTCRSPGQNNLYWYCNQAATGTCTGNAVSIFSDVSSCLPPPSCNPQNLNFTMRFHRCYSSGAGCSNACIGANSPWTMTITGKTLEYTNATAITLSATTICAGQSITANTASSFGVPGYTYNWSLSASMSPSVGSTSSVTIPFPTAGSFTIYNTVTDQCGTVINSSRNVTVNASPVVTASPNPQTICSGQGVGVTLTSSMSTTSYSWTVVQSGVTGASNGSGNGTGGSSTYNLNQTLTNSGTTPGTATYTITPTSSGCTGVPLTLVVTVNPIPTVTNPGNQTICSGQNTNAINFTGTTGATFNWTNDNITTGLGASGSGNIASFIGQNTGTTNNVSNISVTPSFGTCNGTAQNFSITVAPSPTVNAVASQTVCAGQSTAAVTFSGNATTYLWSNDNTAIGLGVSGNGPIPAFTATNSTSNPITAIISVTPTSGTCQGTPTSFTITVNPGVPTPTITTAPATCTGNGTATITNYNATLTYTFSPTGPTAGASGAISGMTVGTSYTVIAGNGSCSSAASASFSITSQLVTPAPPTISVVPPTCTSAGSASITNYSAAVTYTFSPSGPTVGAIGAISGMTNGTNYTVTAGNGSCTSTASNSFSIAGPLATPAAPTITTAPATCSSNGTATITNYVSTQTYIFSPLGPTVGSAGIVSGLTAGTSYSVTTNNGSCTSVASLTFSIEDQIAFPSLQFLVDNPSGCAPHTATLSATNIPGIQYQWIANGSVIGGGSTLTANFTNPGCYNIQLTISNQQGCVATSSELDFICVEANPVASFTPNPTLFTSTSQNVIFSNTSTGAVNYLWEFGDLTTSTESDPVHFYSNLQGGVVVTLAVVSPLGCTDETSYVINFQEETIFYVPNTFTPDQDEFNQTWGPVFTQGFDPFNFDLYIFNRWGELIWESHDATAQWDGNYGDKALHCPQGIYTWKISYKPKETDEKINISGQINLIR
jgi:gliding motility-associated-like protein